MTPQEIHQEIRGRHPAREDHDFELTTDGSGTDVTRIATGSAWTLRPLALQVEWEKHTGEAGASSGSIQRAEMMALLEGLRKASEVLGLEDLDQVSKFCGEKLKRIEDLPWAKRPTIWWVGDRENMVLQVARRPDGYTYYNRRTEPDLWFSLHWYEHLFRITPVHQGRNTSQDQIDVDRRAGETRELFVPEPKVTDDKPQLYKVVIKDNYGTDQGINETVLADRLRDITAESICKAMNKTYVGDVSPYYYVVEKQSYRLKKRQDP